VDPGLDKSETVDWAIEKTAPSELGGEEAGGGSWLELNREYGEWVNVRSACERVPISQLS
jgi:hypothetical protein